MFTEILKILPRVSRSDADQMESSLSRRFGRVAKRFGGGLKSVIKGSIFGISLGLLNRLLNPLEAVEERIKNLLGHGADITDLADRFNTDPGRLQRLQDVAGAQGLDAEHFREMLTKYAQAVETARKELEDPTVTEISPTTRILGDLVKETDLATGFTKFLELLRKEGKGPGRDVFFSDREQSRAFQREATGEQLSPEERAKLVSEGLLKRRTGMESRRAVEEAFFGEGQFGAARRFIDTDVNKKAREMGEPSIATLNKSLKKTANLEAQRRAIEIANNTNGFVKASEDVNSTTVQQMEAAAKKEKDRIDAQLKSFEDLRNTANGIEQIKEELLTISGVIVKGFGQIGLLIQEIGSLKNTRLFKFFNGQK